MKTITSPVKKFPGTVVIKDPLPYPDYIAWEKGLLSEDEKAEITQGELEQSLWSGVFAVIEKWDLENFDPENIPATPRTPVLELLAWVVREIGNVINEVEESPKE